MRIAPFVVAAPLSASPATRADLRLAIGPQGQMFVMNKRDGVIRQLIP